MCNPKGNGVCTSGEGEIPICEEVTPPPHPPLPFCLALLDLCLMMSHRLTLSSGFGPKARIMTDSEGRAAGAKSAGRRGPEGGEGARAATVEPRAS